MANKQAIGPVKGASDTCVVSLMFVGAKAHDKFEGSESVHSITRHFKMEPIRTVKGLIYTTRILHGKEGHLPVGPVTSPSQKVL